MPQRGRRHTSHYLLASSPASDQLGSIFPRSDYSGFLPSLHFIVAIIIIIFVTNGRRWVTQSIGVILLVIGFLYC